jgi:hypothetical protein
MRWREPFSFASLADTVTFLTEEWCSQHHEFIVETFILKMVTVFKTQRIFRRHFNIALHGKVPCRNTIELWVEDFRRSASALKKGPPDSVRTVRLLQNIEAVRQSFIRSHRRSARRHSVALGISDRSVSRILQKDLNFDPYKRAVVRGLSDRDIANRSTVSW